MSVLVNGSSTEYFKVLRGLRQGYPLSPFLFSIVAEGLVVGGNHIRVSFWKPIISCFKARLSSWKGRLLSIGGRVTLINSVLMNLPIHHLSLFKAPANVIQDLISIQRNFLWSGSMEKSSMTWVSWKNVCKPKMNGRLGIKHIGLFSRALLTKWIWRFSKERHAIWIGILDYKYGNILRRLLSKDVSRTRLGDGANIMFWYARWISHTTLKELFHVLYVASNRKQDVVRDMGVWEGEVGNGDCALIN
ncbi:hypothetical protein KIW84_034045 [Lathyrus oleraceus]|uniref:Uncharacterized protein n=1 Tax=Pisum sativum TaxID=3888 RepID=A0A9D4Y094_PEA|nr:hypothetical protein KIW84_034045 [Pisum sativum]